MSEERKDRRRKIHELIRTFENKDYEHFFLAAYDSHTGEIMVLSDGPMWESLGVLEICKNQMIGDRRVTG